MTRTVSIGVSIESVDPQNGTVECSFTENPSNGFLKQKGELDFSSIQNEEFDIAFSLIQEKSHGLSFDTVTGVIKVGSGGKCPSKLSYHSTQFEIKNRSSVGFLIHNFNKYRGDYMYRLNFVNSDLQKYYYDPRIRNGGTNTNQPTFPIYYVFGAVAIIAFVAVGGRLLGLF